MLLDTLNPSLPSISLATYKLEELVLKSVFICTDHQSLLKNGKYALAEKVESSLCAGIHFKVPQVSYGFIEEPEYDELINPDPVYSNTRAPPSSVENKDCEYLILGEATLFTGKGMSALLNLN